MVAWREELARREAAAAEQAADLRRRIGELSEQLDACEQMLARLVVTRETMNEILTAAGGLDSARMPETGAVAGEDADPAPVPPVSGDGGSPVGLVLVPPRRAWVDAAAVLPGDYCDILDVLAHAGQGLRAGQVAAELGIAGTERSKVEALRSKLKRLVARGWAAQQPSGVFTIAE
ncbi:hypothetical protein IU459_37060 [Nocardia amamiensis]|uniref:MarR family transcriptional regulator n=1 Tax=Nocardia amamiensis TaxID=404578 RepID=A0ABS0D341_9NOCA|nr:hypothetical protein [Nocardia amamiensis]MBF6303071.1 hypothetical protein [Nocardia amamiensis]